VVRRVFAAPALALALLAAVPAEAQPRAARPSRTDRESAARAACAEGRVEEGITLLADLYGELAHPNYVYNQARCYQRNGRPAEAITRFEEYLRLTPQAPLEERERIAGFIRGERARLAAAAAAALDAVAPPETSEPSAAPLPETPSAVALADTREKPVATSRRPYRVAAVGLGAAAAIGLITGVVAGQRLGEVDAQVDRWKTRPPASLSEAEVGDVRARGSRYRTSAWAGYGVGAGALAAAVACAVIGWSTPATDGPATALALSAAPGTFFGSVRVPLP
jgi:hypothetical protein